MPYMKELKKLSKNLFYFIEKSQTAHEISVFLYFYDFAKSAKSKSFYDITTWLEKFVIHIFTYDSRTIKDNLIIFNSRVHIIVKCNFAYIYIYFLNMVWALVPIF